MAKDPRTSGGPNKRAGETGSNTSGALNMQFTRERKIAWCKALEEAAGVRVVACRRVGVTRVTVERHLKNDEEFKTLYEESMESFRGVLIKETFRRAVTGTKKPIYFQGKRVVDVDEETDERTHAYVREYDTPLLLTLLKRHCPEFNDKKTVENINTNVDMGMADLDDMTPDQRAKLRALLETEEDGEAR